MSCCDNSKSIVLVRGDDTNFNDQVFLTLRLNTTILDLANSGAKFILGDIVKTYDDLSSGVIEVNYKSSETSTFPEGKLNGVLRIYDRLKRRGTIESYIPFCVISNVSGNAVATQPFEMTINVEQGGENILNIDVEAGVSVEVGSTETLPAGSDAYVQNVGTPNHLVLKFGIPEGEKGEDGAEGPEGPEGPAGKDGVDGKDAKINGVNTLTLNATNGLTLTQSGNVATLSGKSIQDSVTTEATNRSNADNNLQQQIDAIVASSDVTDIVGTYAQLMAYDTSTLPPNSIIKVLQDESKDNETTYYRWVITEGVGSWVLIGEEGPYYTKSEADGKFVPKTTTINGKALSGNISLDANDVGAATSVQGAKADTAVQPGDLGSAAYENSISFATAAQGTKADTAVQPNQLGTAAYENANSFATAAQGTKADTALQPNDNISELNNDAGFITLSALSAYQEKATIQTLSATDSITLADNTIYNGGEQTALTIALPATVDVSFLCEIDFTSGTTATTLAYPNNVKWLGDDVANNVFVPVASKRYTIICAYDGVNYRFTVKGV